MEVIAVILAVAFFVLMFYCIRKEKSLSGFYSSINICGRGRAFFTVYFLILGVGCTIALPVSLILSLTGYAEVMIENHVAFAICAALGWLVGLALYRKVYNRCPDCLKKRLLRDMLVIMLGVQFRVSLFFMMFIFRMWWEMNRPTAYVVDGRTVYAYPGSNDLYDESGYRVGTANDDRTSAVMD